MKLCKAIWGISIGGHGELTIPFVIPILVIFKNYKFKCIQNLKKKKISILNCVKSLYNEQNNELTMNGWLNYIYSVVWYFYKKLFLNSR